MEHLFRTPLILAILSLSTLSAQDSARQLIDTAFEQARPAGERSTKARPAFADPKRGNASYLGVTLWKLRPSGPADGDGGRLLVQPQAGGKTESWSAERTDPAHPHKAGERVRISVESPTDGYLYVIDREVLQNGKSGRAALIFPTKRARGGDNRVTPGRVIEIPAQSDATPYFELQPGQPDQVADMLLLLVTKEPIPGFAVPDDSLEMSAAQIATWESRYNAPVTTFNTRRNVGKLWTSHEQQAGVDGARLLVQGDPLPQTIFSAASRDRSILVHLELRYRP